MLENRMSCEKLVRVFDHHSQAVALLKNLVACLYNPALDWRTAAERAEHYLLGREERAAPPSPKCEHNVPDGDWCEHCSRERHAALARYEEDAANG